MVENQAPKLPRRKTSGFIWLFLFLLFGIPLTLALVVPTAQEYAQEAGRRAVCLNNLKNIELGLLNYHETYGRFPPAYTVDAEGKPLHSWRALLLPYFERTDVYDAIHFDEPWNSPDNLAVYESCTPSIYQCPTCPELKPNRKTTYVMVTGPKCVSDGPHSCSLEEIMEQAGRTSETIHVTETTVPVRWYEPKDLKADEINFKINDETSPGIGSWHPGLVVAAFCDGHIETIDEDIAPEELRAMFEVQKETKPRD